MEEASGSITPPNGRVGNRIPHRHDEGMGRLATPFRKGRLQPTLNGRSCNRTSLHPGSIPLTTIPTSQSPTQPLYNRPTCTTQLQRSRSTRRELRRNMGTNGGYSACTPFPRNQRSRRYKPEATSTDDKLYSHWGRPSHPTQANDLRSCTTHHGSRPQGPRPRRSSGHRNCRRRVRTPRCQMDRNQGKAGSTNRSPRVKPWKRKKPKQQQQQR